VLVVVQHRQQDVQLAEQVTDPAARGDPHIEVRAVPPPGKPRIERDRPGAHLVAERLEQPPQQFLTAAARQHRQPRGQFKLLLRQPGTPLHWPRSAVPNIFRSATLRKDDAAYGRSFT